MSSNTASFVPPGDFRRSFPIGRIKEPPNGRLCELGVSHGQISRAWYGAEVEEFQRTDAETILGQIAKHAEYDVVLTQRNAWLTQIELLRAAFDGLTGNLFFEFSVPRVGRRIDVVLITGAIAFAIEFKIGEDEFGALRWSRCGTTRSISRTFTRQVTQSRSRRSWSCGLHRPYLSRSPRHDGVYRPLVTPQRRRS